MKNTIQELVVGFTLRINKQTHRVNINKAVYDVAVGVNENDRTRIILVSPKGRSWTRVTNIIGVNQEDEMSKIRIGSKERVVDDISINEWDKLRDGAVLKKLAKNSKIDKYFSLNLDRLLELVKESGATIDDALVFVLKETEIR